jgi:hypothetical protein
MEKKMANVSSANSLPSSSTEVTPDVGIAGVGAQGQDTKPSFKQIAACKQLFEKLKGSASGPLLSAWQSKLEASHAGTLSEMKDVYGQFAAEVTAALTRKGERGVAVALGSDIGEVDKEISDFSSTVLEKWKNLHGKNSGVSSSQSTNSGRSESIPMTSSTRPTTGNRATGSEQVPAGGSEQAPAGGDSSSSDLKGKALMAYKMALSAMGLSKSHIDKKLATFEASLAKGDIGADTKSDGGEFKKILIKARSKLKADDAKTFDSLLVNEKGINFGLASVVSASAGLLQGRAANTLPSELGDATKGAVNNQAAQPAQDSSKANEVGSENSSNSQQVQASESQDLRNLQNVGSDLIDSAVN